MIKFPLFKRGNQMIQSSVDRIISHLITKRYCREWSEFRLSYSEIEQLCLVCGEIFSKESTLLQLKAPIKIAGNLHGQFNTLLSIFEHGLPPQSNYLFLGNYGDRWELHFETLVLLLALKIKYPDNIFLLRGSHDGTRSPIFVDECEIDQIQLFQSIEDCLNCLPIAALIDDKILCTYGGLSPYLQNLDQIRHIKRPIKNIQIWASAGLLRDLLGSDPTKANNFGPDRVKRFLVKHDLHLICCAYQVENGYKVFAEQRLVSICSASSSGVDPKFPQDDFDDVGAMMSVDPDLMYSFLMLEPKKRYWKFIFQDYIPQSWDMPSKTLTSKSNSGSSTSTELPESSSGGLPSTSKPPTKYTSTCFHWF